MAKNPNLEGIEERVAKIEADRKAREEARQARWDFYYEQLAKHTPFQGGAKGRSISARIDAWE